jgi:hypothetical protein
MADPEEKELFLLVRKSAGLDERRGVNAKRENF